MSAASMYGGVVSPKQQYHYERMHYEMVSRGVRPEVARRIASKVILARAKRRRNLWRKVKAVFLRKLFDKRR